MTSSNESSWKLTPPKWRAGCAPATQTLPFQSAIKSREPTCIPVQLLSTNKIILWNRKYYVWMKHSLWWVCFSRVLENGMHGKCIYLSENWFALVTFISCLNKHLLQLSQTLCDSLRKVSAIPFYIVVNGVYLQTWTNGWNRTWPIETIWILLLYLVVIIQKFRLQTIARLFAKATQITKILLLVYVFFYFKFYFAWEDTTEMHTLQK